MIQRRLTIPVWIMVGIFVLMPGICPSLSRTPTLALGSAATQQSTADHDRLCREDIDVFVEAMWRNGDQPRLAVADRMLWRARENRDDPELLYWASHAAMMGWTSNGAGDATALLQKAADLNYSPAIRDLGMFQCLGINGVALDKAVGLKHLRNIADTGDPRALYFLGGLYANGYGGLEKDLNSAWQYTQCASDAGYLPAITGLAQICTAKGDHKKAEMYWIRSADAGDVTAMRVLVDPSQSPATARNPAMVYRYLMRGWIWKDDQLGRMLAAHILQEPAGPDYRVAQYLLQTAAGNGDIRAMALQARARLQGLWYTPQNVARGRRELQWLSDGADPTGSAAFLLGQALWDGADVSPDSGQALKLIHKAATTGFKPARAWLANHDLTRKPLSSDPTTHPSTNSEIQIAMESLKDTLFEASIAQDALPVGPPAMPEADQELEDNDEFQESVYYVSSPLSRSVIDRIVRRASGGAANSRTKTWAAEAVLNGAADQALRPQAAEWLDDAAKSGDAIARSFYGGLLLNGDPAVGLDTREGLMWLQRARNQGEPQADVQLGVAYLLGRPGLAQDIQKGLALLTEAHDKGLQQGLWFLTTYYFNAGDQAASLPFIGRGCHQALSIVVINDVLGI